MTEQQISFPNESEFINDIYQASDVPNTISKLSKFLATLNTMDCDNFSPDTYVFISMALPPMWLVVCNLESSSKATAREISRLNEEYVTLIANGNLPAEMIFALATAMDDVRESAQFVEIKIKKLSEREIEERFHFDPKWDYLKKHRPPITAALVSLIPLLFTKGLFKAAREKIEKKELSVEQCESILVLFLSIQSCVKSKYVSLMLPLMIQGAIDVLSGIEDGGNERCVTIARYLTKFITQLPERLDETLTLFCRMSEKGSVHVRMSFLSNIIQLVKAIGLGTSAETVKQAMLRATFDRYAHHELLETVLKFLPVLAEKVPLSEEDVMSLIMEDTPSENLRYDCIVQLLPSFTESLDTLATKVMNDGIFYPALRCALIGRVSNRDLAKELFHGLLLEPSKLQKYDLTSIAISDELKVLIDEVMNSDDSVSLLFPLSFFFFNSPNMSATASFVERLINLAPSHPNLFDILMKFASVGKSFDCSNALSVIMTRVFEGIDKKSPGSNVSPVVRKLVLVLTEWLKCLDRCETDELILKQLRGIPCSCWPSELYGLVDVILQKPTKNEHLRKLALRLFDDTVTPSRASWAINILYLVAKFDKPMATNLASYLVSHLDRETKSNAIAMLWHAVQSEADFFGMNRENGLNVTIIIKQNPPVHLRVSLHPMHSTRRIYFAVSKALNLPVESFSLQLLDREQENELPYGRPLNSLTFSSCYPLIFHVRKLENPPESAKDIIQRTPVMEALNNDVVLSQIFRNIKGDFDDQLLVQILMLYEPFVLLPQPQTPFQQIFFGRVENLSDLGQCHRVFPWAVRAYLDTNQDPEVHDIEMILLNLSTGPYDAVSLGVACSALVSIGRQFVFSQDVLKQCLLSADQRIVRETCLRLISPQQPKESIIRLLPLTTEQGMRSRSREFYQLAKLLCPDPELYVPFFTDLKQFEVQFYGEVDETYVGLMSLLPATPEIVKLTLSRLFAPPSCMNMIQPFVHTLESWKASLLFLLHPCSLPFLPVHLEGLPTVASMASKLSGDFTYKGTNGIMNLGATCYLNSLLQVLNVMPIVSGKLISLETEGLSPFVLQLRDFLAKLKLTRGTVLSTRPIVDTIPNFDVTIQEDAGEFLNMIITRINDELPDGEEITSHMLIKSTAYVRAKDDDRILAKGEERGYYLSIPTKGLSRLDEAFSKYSGISPLEGYVIDGEKVSAYRQSVIQNWPDYLTIHLQRYDYTLETGQREKLVHEFAFPFELNSRELQREAEEDADYSLNAVIVHQGNAERGHYLAIVKGQSGDWYVCNDQSVEYFEITEIKDWAYGVSDDRVTSIDRIWTGYLLFYKKKTLKTEPVHLPDDLETKLNTQNQVAWPSTIFYSKEFVGFVQDLVMMNPRADEAALIALNVLFKVVVVKDRLLEDWVSFILENVLVSDSRVWLFFDFLQHRIGKNLGRIVGISDTGSKELTRLILTTFSRIRNSTKPLLIVLQNLNFTTTRRVMSLIMSLINSALTGLTVDWPSEVEVISLVIFYVAAELPKDLAKELVQLHSSVFDMLIDILHDVLNESIQSIDAISSLFDVEVLNRIYGFIKKSDSFQRLVQKVNAIRPDVIPDLADASPQVRALLIPAMSLSSRIHWDDDSDLDLSFVWRSMNKILFSKKDVLRERATELALAILGKPSDELVSYVQHALISTTAIKPPVLEDKSVAMYFVGLLPIFCKDIAKSKKLGNNASFVKILEVLCYTAPNALRLYSNQIFDVFIDTKDARLMTVVHHILALYPEMIEELGDDIIECILSVDTASEAGIQLLRVLKDRANHSKLSGACLEKCLSVGHGSSVELMLELIHEGLVPGYVELPEVVTSLAVLRFANALWDRWEDRRDCLAGFMMKCLALAKPWKLFSKSESVSRCYQILKECGYPSVDEVVCL